MARIDIFLDMDEVLKGYVFEEKETRYITFEGSIRRLNFFISHQQRLGHDITIVPVTSHRDEKSADELRDEIETLGVTAGLPFIHFDDGSRASVVTRRLAQGQSDAYVVFDDNADAYPHDQANLIVVRARPFDKIPDHFRGISQANIHAANLCVSTQIGALVLPLRRDLPGQTGPQIKGPADDVA